MASDSVRDDIERIRADGYVVIERLLGDADLRAIRAALDPHLQGEHFGRNDFEGFRTERVYRLPALGRAFADLIEHPRILAICDALLSPNYLLSAAQAIRIHPGEDAQALHYDDAFYQAPRPRAAFSVSTIWAVDEFTAENGATEIVPRSHLWGDEVPAGAVSGADFAQQMAYGRGPAGPAAELMRERPAPATLAPALEPVRMAPGSVVVFLGTLWHRGGVNASPAPRLALTTQYCEPWARPQENYFLAVPLEVARGLSERVQELLGYSIHPPFMGHAGGLHPKRLLGREPQR